MVAKSNVEAMTSILAGTDRILAQLRDQLTRADATGAAALQGMIESLTTDRANQEEALRMLQESEERNQARMARAIASLRETADALDVEKRGPA